MLSNAKQQEGSSERMRRRQIEDRGTDVMDAEDVKESGSNSTKDTKDGGKDVQRRESGEGCVGRIGRQRRIEGAM